MTSSQKKLLQLYFIRHGETEWSLSGQHTGVTDIALTAHGENEARQLAPCLRRIEFASVLCSPRQRAWRTCALAGLEPLAVIEPDLAEWDYGDYEGRRSIDIHKETPGWNVFQNGCPGGEMPSQVSERVDRLILRLQALQGNVALFSHGQFGCALAARWIGLTVSEGRHFALGSASLSRLGYEVSHPTTPVIALWNLVPTALGAAPLKGMNARPRKSLRDRAPQLEDSGMPARFE